jgi:hypothetical protein
MNKSKPSHANPTFVTHPNLEVHERLDEIAEQTRWAANQLADAATRYQRGDVSLTELNGVRLTVEALVRAWDLEADVRRRRPR